MEKLFKKFRKGIPVYLLTFAALLFTVNSFGQTSKQDGPWSDPNTWTGGVPGANAKVTITHNVTHAGGTLTLNELKVISGGFLNAPGLSISIVKVGSSKGAFIVGDDTGPAYSKAHINNLDIDTHPGTDAGVMSYGVLTLEGNFTMGSRPGQFQLDGLMEVYGNFETTASGGDNNFGVDGGDGGTLIVHGCFTDDCTGFVFGVRGNTIDPACNYGPIGAFTWVGEYSENWETPGNWYFLGSESVTKIPDGNYNITIPIVASGNYYPDYTNTVERPVVGDCKDLTIVPGAQMNVTGNMHVLANLLLKADAADGAASFMATGYANVNGGTKAQVYVPVRGNGWAMVSPPLVTPVNAFINDPDNGVTSNIGLLNESLSKWDWYDGTNPDFDLKPGVAVMLSAGGVVEFSGTLPVLSGPLSDVVTPVVHSTYGFNGFGNPYTSSLGMDAYLTANTGWQTGTPTAWFYNGTNYEAFDLDADGEFAQTGQGFIMQATISSTEVSLDETTMQFHNPLTTIKSGTSGKNKFKLNATLNGLKKSTKVNMRPDRTVGLDPKYDAKLFNQSEFELYSMIEGYPEVNFEIQGIPDYNLNGVVLPIGLDCVRGGDVTFNVSDLNLPEGVLAMFLEDKETGRFTDLTSAPYTAEVEAGTSGEGRFFIHFKSLSTGIEIDEVQPLKAFYKGNKEIQIEGQVGSKSIASVFDMSGKLLGNYQLKGENHNVIPVGSLENGVYILRVVDGERVYKTRIPVL